MQEALLLAGPVLQVALLAIIYRKGLHRQFPWFCTYTGFSIAAQLARVLVSQSSYKLYFWLYWSTDAAFAVLSFLALYEVFRAVFRNYTRLGWFRPVLLLAGTVLLVMASYRAWAAPPTEASRVVAAVLSLQIGVRIIQCGVLLLLFALVALVGLHWRQYAFGIALGFGLYATVNLAGGLLRSEFGTKYNFLLSMAWRLAYTLAVLIWLWFFSRPQPEEPPRSGPPPLPPEELDRYKQAAKDFMRR